MLEAALAIKGQGNEVRVIAMHNPGSKSRENIKGIEVIRPRYLPDRWEILQKDSAGLPQAWQSNPWAKLAILPFFLIHTVAVAYWSRDCDIIHAQWTISGASVWITRWFHRCPYVVTIHGSDIFKAARMWLPKIITKRVLSGANKVIAVSQALVDNVTLLGIKQKNIEVISNGVNLELFSYDPATKREPIILFVGSLIHRKGIDILLNAFSKLLIDLPLYNLVIVGEGILKDYLKFIAKDLGISDKVIFTGFQTQEQVHLWMQKAKVFVLPSIEEGQGVVLLEALASGTPCVGSKVGGIPDVIKPDFGRLVEPSEPIALNQALLEVINSPDWEMMSLNARRQAENKYKWPRIVEKIINVYKHALAETK